MFGLSHSKLKSKDPEERREAVEKMGLPGNARAIVPLTVALEDEDRAVREAAAAALGKIGDYNATEALAAALMRKDYVMVQAKAAISLGRIGDAGGIAALTAALNRELEQKPNLEGSQQDKVLRGIFQMPELDIKDDDAKSVFLQMAAAIALAQTQNSKAARTLAETLADEKSDLMRFQIAGSLKKYAMPIEVRKLEAEFGFSLEEVISKAESHLGDVGAYAARAIESMLVD